MTTPTFDSDEPIAEPVKLSPPDPDGPSFDEVPEPAEDDA